MSEKQKQPKIVVEKDEQYRDVIVNGVFGGIRPGYLEVLVYTDKMVGDEALTDIPPAPEKIYVTRVVQCRLVIDPVQAKSIAEWLTRQVLNYESAFGKIATPEDFGKKFAKDDKTPRV